MLLVFVAISLYPVLNVVSISLRPGDKLMSADLSLIPENWTFESYVRLFTDQPVLIWLRNSLLVVSLVTLMGVVLASISGYAFSRFRFVGRGACLVIILVTQMFPATMLMLPLYVLIAKLHLVNTFLGLKSFQASMTTQWGLYAASAILARPPVVAIFLLLSRYLVSGLTLGSVKE